MGFFSGIIRSVKKITKKVAPILGFVAGAVVGGFAGGYLTNTVGGIFARTILGTSIGNIVGGLAGALVGGAVSGALSDSSGSVSGDSGGILANKQSNNAPIPVVYGRRKVGGTRVFIESAGDKNKYIHIVLVFCEGFIDQFHTIYLDDVALTDSKFSGKYQIEYIHGSDGQASFPNLTADVANWTSAHRLRGIAGIHIRLEYDQDVFSGGLPTITADISGKQVYDPRTATTAWSDNPALAIRDYLINTRYGRGIDSSLIDDTLFSDMADYCDETVTIGGTTKKRYTLNGVVDTSVPALDIIRNLCTACRGAVIFSGGKYRLVIDKPATASFTFDEDNIVGSWSIKMPDKKNQFNRIKANFYNPDRNWQPDIAVVDSSTLRSQDNGLLLEKAIELPFTDDIDRVKMISTINLNQSRQSMLVEFTATIEGMRCEVWDLVYIKHTTPAWDTMNSGLGKLFRVIDMTLQNNNEVRVTCLEYDADSYDFGTINVSDTAPDTNLPNLTSIVAPTGLSASESLYATIGSAGVKTRVELAWIESQDIFTQSYDVEWKESSQSTYKTLTNTKNTTARLDDANPVEHDFRVRAINTIGVRSSWATLKNFTVAGLTTPPVDLTGLEMVAINNNAHFSWDLATDLDVKIGGKVRFKYSSKTSGAVWGSATDIGSAVAGHNTNAVLPLLKGTYLAKFVDSAGNESDNATTFILNQVPDILPMNIVTTSTQHPNFTGAKTNMVAVDDVLKFEADTLIDSITDYVDDWELIDALGGVDTSGTYEFDNYIDLGQAFTSRVTASLEFTGFVTNDLIDDRTALMDTWTDFENFPSDITVNLYVATTFDDPSGTPTWSAWQKFTVGDYACRAYKFKVEASTTNPDHQINITALSVEVDMPDRVQGENAITTLNTGLKTITFPQPFKIAPALSVTIVDAHSNDLLEVTNITPTTFDVGIYHGSNYVEHDINYVAKGY